MSDRWAGGHAKPAVVADEEKGLLERILDDVSGEVGRAGDARAQDAAERARELVQAYVKRLRDRQVTFDKNLPTTINAMVKEIDEQISGMLKQVMHDPAFLKIEGRLARLSLPHGQFQYQRHAEDQNAAGAQGGADP